MPRAGRWLLPRGADQAPASPSSNNLPPVYLHLLQILLNCRDGLDMFLRTLTLQATFIMALAAAARLGTVALAAHSIVGQCWVLISYAVDGFAAAAIVLGSRLAGCGAGTPQRRAAAKR